MKKSLSICFAAALILIASGKTGVMGTPVVVTLTPADFDDLLGGPAVPIDTPMTTEMSTGNLKAKVISQALTDNLGNYAYLYQVINIGTVGNSVVEVFTCSPFFGISPSTTFGYLTANAPAGFTLGEQAPIGASLDEDAGPTISLGFPSPWIPGFPSYAIDPGESSKTLYILISNGTPGIITGNVIDGTIATGNVVGAIIPEPATIALLGLCGLSLLRGKRKA